MLQIDLLILCYLPQCSFGLQLSGPPRDIEQPWRCSEPFMFPDKEICLREENLNMQDRSKML
jgi:hypothetical protein